MRLVPQDSTRIPAPKSLTPKKLLPLPFIAVPQSSFGGTA